MGGAKADTDLYRLLRDRGVRRRAARLASTALALRGPKRSARALRVADELAAAAEAIRERAADGSGERSRGRRARTANEAERRGAAREDARSVAEG